MKTVSYHAYTATAEACYPCQDCVEWKPTTAGHREPSWKRFVPYRNGRPVHRLFAERHEHSYITCRDVDDADTAFPWWLPADEDPVLELRTGGDPPTLEPTTTERD